jgi:trans-2,3-dihydro-3-hydroxyanthranilate isomerase
MRYLLFDVFAERAFEGNQLAVFPGAHDADGETMQRAAKELNLSESIFLTKTGEDSAPARVRIFTPAQEIPFAGHPTIGATVALADVLKWVPRERTRFVLKERVGDVAVRVERNGATTAWLTTPPVTFGDRVDRTAAAAMLQLDPIRLREGTPPQLAGAGTPFLYVPLADVESVDAARLDEAAMLHAIGDPARVAGIFFFCVTGSGTYARMFAPMSGIAEDPATGSATGPLFAYLIEHGVLERQATSYVALQGVKMGRRSVLHVNVMESNGDFAYEVGGRAIHVGSGELHDF